MAILAAFMVPHPPMIVPAVGRGSEKQIQKTIDAYEQVADEIAALAPETIIITSPHTVMYADYFHISPGKGAKGDFGRFRAAQVCFDEEYDRELVNELAGIARGQGFPAGVMGERDKRLDHGTMVPLYFIRRKYTGAKIVRIGLSGLPLSEHYRFGQMIREAVDKLGRKAVFVASGDLSHKLQDYGPYGFAEEGPQYDARIMDVCSRAAFGELFDFDETFCDRAAECGHRSFVIMAGAFDGLAVGSAPSIPAKRMRADISSSSIWAALLRDLQKSGPRKIPTYSLPESLWSTIFCTIARWKCRKICRRNF